MTTDPEIERIAELCWRASGLRLHVEFARCSDQDRWRNVALADREALVNALRGAVDWMAEDGCDCGTDEPGTCALCVAEATLREINNG